MMEKKLSHALSELAFQIEEKEKRAEELLIANKELIFQNQEKENRAAELILANKELIFQNTEKEKRAEELILANKELHFQNTEKGKRAAELIIANKELAFQNTEKEMRATELDNVNRELAFQIEEKGKRAVELAKANQELAFQNSEKEKRAAELIIAYKDLESFNYISSHDLQEPLRKIQVFTSRILEDEYNNLSEKGKDQFNGLKESALRMQKLIIDLLAYSHANTKRESMEKVDLNQIIEKVKEEFSETINRKNAVIAVNVLCKVNVVPFQFHQLMYNIIDNALKFSKPESQPYITIRNHLIKNIKPYLENLIPEKEYCQITISDNGLGFEPEYKNHIFEIFQRLHGNKIPGTGIGLAIANRIVQNHGGTITAIGEPDIGATFNIFLPVN